MKHIFLNTFLIVFLLDFIHLACLHNSQAPDATLDFEALARKYGFKPQKFNLTTKDGYILTLHRIPGNKTKSVLLMHGLLDSSDTFILRGRNSLVAVLSEAHYDVWIGNCRGNKHSRRHKHLNPDTDKEFWNFSFHEMAVFDLRLYIDFILLENNETSLSLIGHSQGNSLFYVLGSTMPEYNNRVSIAIALGPIAYLNEDNYPPPLDVLFKFGPAINQWWLANNVEEIFGADSLIIKFRDNVCTQGEIGYAICAGGIFSSFGGEDQEELEPDFFYSLMGHYPTSTSRKNVLHLLQVAKRKAFAQFDHGPKTNMKVYQSETPPPYDLSKVTMKVALIVGRNDKLVPLRNVELLRHKLPNVVSYNFIEREKFNHVDHIWGKHMRKYLFPHIMRLLDKYV